MASCWYTYRSGYALSNVSARAISSGDCENSLGDGKSLSLKVLTEPVEGAENIVSSYATIPLVQSLWRGRGRRCRRSCFPDNAEYPSRCSLKPGTCHPALG